MDKLKALFIVFFIITNIKYSQESPLSCEWDFTRSSWCPSYSKEYMSQWQRQARCLSCPIGMTYHCARVLGENEVDFKEQCAVPRDCVIGTEPRIGLHDGKITCENCHDPDRFNDYDNTSSATFSECPLKKTICIQTYNRIECGRSPKFSSENRYCRCDARKNYVFSSGQPNKDGCSNSLSMKCSLVPACPGGKDRSVKGESRACLEHCPPGYYRRNNSDDCFKHQDIPDDETTVPNSSSSISYVNATLLPPVTTSQPQDVSPSEQGSKLSSGAIVGIVIACLVLVIIGGCGIKFCGYSWRKDNGNDNGGRRKIGCGFKCCGYSLHKDSIDNGSAYGPVSTGNPDPIPKPVNLEVKKISSTSITLDWLYLHGVNSWQVTVTENGSIIITKQVDNSDSERRVETKIKGLQAGHHYKFIVRAKVEQEMSEGAKIEATTKATSQSAPHQVINQYISGDQYNTENIGMNKVMSKGKNISLYLSNLDNNEEAKGTSPSSSKKPISVPEEGEKETFSMESNTNGSKPETDSPKTNYPVDATPEQDNETDSGHSPNTTSEEKKTPPILCIKLLRGTSTDMKNKRTTSLPELNTKSQPSANKKTGLLRRDSSRSVNQLPVWEKLKKIYKRVIDKCSGQLKEDLHPDGILDFAQQNNMFRFTCIRDIREMKSTTEKNSHILDLIRGGGVRKYWEIKQHLKGHQQNLVDVLEEAEDELTRELAKHPESSSSDDDSESADAVGEVSYGGDVDEGQNADGYDDVFNNFEKENSGDCAQDPDCYDDRETLSPVLDSIKASLPSPDQLDHCTNSSQTNESKKTEDFGKFVSLNDSNNSAEKTTDKGNGTIHTFNLDTVVSGRNKTNRTDNATTEGERIEDETDSAKSLQENKNYFENKSKTEGIGKEYIEMADVNQQSNEQCEREKENQALQKLHLLKQISTENSSEKFESESSKIKLEIPDSIDFKSPEVLNITSSQPYKSLRNCPIQYQAFASSGRFNSCLYQSISLLLANTEGFQHRLRLAATVHAACNRMEYVKHHTKLLQDKFGEVTIDAILSYFSAHLPDDIVARCNQPNIQPDALIENFVIAVIMDTAKLGSESSQLQVVFLAGALNRRIHQYFQTKSSYDLEREVVPNVGGATDTIQQEPLCVMWINYSDKVDGRLDHIVPLLKL